MVQFSKIIEAAVANRSEAMETRDHFKNGASSKSHTSRRVFLWIIAFFVLFGNFCYGQQNEVAGNTKQEILSSGRGVEIDGIVWSTSDVGIRGSFDSHSRENGSRYSTKEYDVCPAGWRLPTKEEFENLIKNPKEFTSEGVFIGNAPNRVFFSFNKGNSVTYWSGSYRTGTKLITRRPTKCRYYLSIHSDYTPEVVEGAMKEQMKCRCVLDTIN